MSNSAYKKKTGINQKASHITDYERADTVASQKLKQFAHDPVTPRLTPTRNKRKEMQPQKNRKDSHLKNQQANHIQVTINLQDKI